MTLCPINPEHGHMLSWEQDTAGHDRDYCPVKGHSFDEKGRATDGGQFFIWTLENDEWTLQPANPVTTSTATTPAPTTNAASAPAPTRKSRRMTGSASRATSTTTLPRTTAPIAIPASAGAKQTTTTSGSRSASSKRRRRTPGGKR